MSPTVDLLVSELYIYRYVIASVYIVLLLEHLASLPQEIEFIWGQKTPGSLPRFFFLLYRYSAVAGLTIINHIMAGISRPLERNHCKQAIAMIAALSIFSTGIADALVMLRVSVLWGRQRLILGILLFSCFSTFSAAAISLVILATKLVANAEVVPSVSLCVFPIGGHQVTVGVWVPGMVFDGLVLSLAGWNACARPRTQQTAFTVALYRDGVIVFLILAGLRAVSLFASVFGSELYLLGLCISWPMSTITLSRFIFRLRRLEKGLALPSNSAGDTAVANADSGSYSLPAASSVSVQARHNSLG